MILPKVLPIFIFIAASFQVQLPDTADNPFVYLEKHNYTYENHTITTDDGYVLLTVRIPHGKNSPQPNITGPPVIFVHCIFCSFYDFLNAGPDRSLGLEVLDQGYDVWLLNIRGNTFSKKHTTLDPELDAAKFWNFSWHEAAINDVPANIDYITKLTGHSKVSYVCHSQGCTIFLAMAASKPKYNEKINFALLLAPVSYLDHSHAPFARFLGDAEKIIYDLETKYNIHEVLPYSTGITSLAQMFCNVDSAILFLCGEFFELAAGPSTQADPALYAVMATNDPAGASVKQMIHYMQIAIAGEFQLYDYGTSGNQIAYNQETPPQYNLSSITVPMALYYGSDDYFVATEDVARLVQNLKSVVVNQLIPYEKTNHLDPLWGTQAVALVHKPGIKLLNEYNSRD